MFAGLSLMQMVKLFRYGTLVLWLVNMVTYFSGSCNSFHKGKLG